MRPGDSLSNIASRHNISVAELSRINNISNPNHIRAGQTLKIRGGAKVKDSRSNQNQYASNRNYKVPPANKNTDHSVQASSTYTNQPIPKMGGWHKPTQGQVIRSFNPNLPGHKGIQIAGNFNQPVNSANNGVVVYAGQGSGGFGQLVMVKHANNVYTAYGYLSSVTVREGQKVSSSQQIGTMGTSPEGKNILHFEVRVNGNPINPTRYVNF
ncbi:peptidoglycan DD-metalloendopeptidase family protein [Wohlfahrtiimonas larvae]|uniref:Peptidoglycan DD-metalloendopeptidase family protein n=1 Tax=Wohlfahrtiimonas larvae TaxID=1157986 RepID=A0ABP9MD32_9GAMM